MREYKKSILKHGVVCVDPIPDACELEAFYAHQYYQQANSKTSTYDASYTQAELQHKILEADIAIESIKQAHSKSNSKRVLELGCGEGFFLKQADRAGWSVKGIDFSNYGVKKWAPELLDKCEFGDAYKFLDILIEKKERFDICALRNVLEHVRDPNLLLTRLKDILNEDGILLVTIPNDYSGIQELALELGHIDTEFWFGPLDHLYYFNTQNIKPFVEELGFQVVDMFTSFPVDFFLFHEGSNYVKDKTNGKAAHFARINIDLLMAKSGIKAILDLYRAMAKCSVGRCVTVLMKKNTKKMPIK
jgi:2-polyprenyl-3-methyl-5-hydroxy-6-metoxy-1,4-benzoquinol methylase